MELERDGDALRTRDGRAVEIEPACVYPLAKGTDLVRGRLPPSHRVIVTQRSLGEDTAWMAVEAPRAWAYLHAHRADFEARRSVIYRGRAPFSVFGVGPYSFAPWKVAISGLHKELTFALVGPCEGRPTLLDDTCYFLPFDTESEAQRALAKLRSPAAQAFFRARVFWDAKRPITKALLQRLDLSKVNA
jgi:hypothetical protein